MPTDPFPPDPVHVRPSGLLAGSDRALRRGQTLLVSPELWTRLGRARTPAERRRLLDAVPVTLVLDPPAWGAGGVRP